MNQTMTHPTGLPDPDYDHAFYDGVPAKRLLRLGRRRDPHRDRCR
jgi:hypothetical protein